MDTPAPNRGDDVIGFPGRRDCSRRCLVNFDNVANNLDISATAAAFGTKIEAELALGILQAEVALAHRRILALRDQDELVRKRRAAARSRKRAGERADAPLPERVRTREHAHAPALFRRTH